MSAVPAFHPRWEVLRRTPPAAVALHAVALGTALYALAGTARRGIAEPGVALAFGAVVALGELARWYGTGQAAARRETAPLAAAGGLGYALLGVVGGGQARHGLPQTVAVVGAAALAGAAPHLLRARAAVLDHLARRVVLVTVAALCCAPLSASVRWEGWGGRGLWLLLALAVPFAAAAGCDAVLTAVLARARTGRPFRPLLRDELRALRGIGSAVCANGVVLALGVAVAGLWALPVFCVPLLLTRFAARRRAAARTTCRQTVASLARSTEIAGCTPPGHARRVAALSRAVGRELGLSERELTVLEYAALLHDVGQLSLPDPAPGGATEPMPPADRRRIALLGGAVVRQTGVPAEVAVVVERQADPYAEQPLPARIVRTANAYEDLAGPGGGRDEGCAPGMPYALERLRLATVRDHEPRVVEALARVLERSGHPAARRV